MVYISIPLHASYNINMTPKLIAFAGPSAIGKTYVADQLVQLHPGLFEQPNLYTTRPQRKGQVSTDRTHVSLNEFNAMVAADMFSINAEFGGNLYGFTHDSLTPKDNKHIVMNIWPWLMPQFTKMDHAVIVVMKPPENWQTLLTNRMKLRGDSAQTIEKRIPLIQKDLQDLHTALPLISAHDKIFTVVDDTTVHEQIIPWLTQTLNL